MESTGKAGKVQVSLETAELLREAGRGGWVLPRNDTVIAKGKGQLKTFWLDTAAARRGEHSDDASSRCSVDSGGFNTDKERSRLVDWNTDQLLSLIKKIVAYRQETSPNQLSARSSETFALKKDRTYLDEVAEVIHLPKSTGIDYEGIDVNDVHIDPRVVSELRALVQNIAALYNDNPFHNFEVSKSVCM